MSTQRRLAVLGATATLAAAAIAGLAAPAGAAPTPQFTRLAGSVAAFTKSSHAIGAVQPSVRLSVQVWLKPDLAPAERYATAVSTPGSAQFGHYLSPDAFTRKFGASASAAAKVRAWLRSRGFTAITTDSQRNYVRATAAVATIDSAFQTRLEYYQSSAAASAGPYRLRANSRPVTIPASLSGAVLGVTGLVNAKPVLPMQTLRHLPAHSAKVVKQAAKRPFVPCSQYYGQHMQRNLPKKFGVHNFPTEGCGYNALQLRSAYGASHKLTGRGQTVALIELGLTPDMFTTLRDYTLHNFLPAPSPQHYSELSLGRGTACGDLFDIEEQLDVEASYMMAPSINQLVVGGDSCDNGDSGLQGLFNADLAVIDGNGHHPLATIASNSWEAGGEEQTPQNTAIETSYLVRAAAEGVGMYFSSADSSGVWAPSDNPFSVAVGGTTLGIGAHRNRIFETGWSTSISFLFGKQGWFLLGEDGATGGGPSMLWKQPAYQKGVVPARFARQLGNRPGLIRSVPDISADADPFTGMAIGYLVFPPPKSTKPPKYVQSDIGGTSVAAPLIAGIVASAQQGEHRAFGFLNPALYKLAGTPALYQPLPLTSQSPVAWRGNACTEKACGIEAFSAFDVQTYKMFGYYGQVTQRGYNNMTGLGTPHGQIFIRDLRALER